MPRRAGGSPEHPADHFPFREERLEESELVAGIASRVFASTYGVNEGGQNITALDLPGTPKMERSEAKNILMRMLELREHEFYSAGALERMNYALSEGRRYLVEHQQMDPRLVPNIPPLKNADELVALFQKTMLFQPLEKRSSRREAEIVMYCSLLSAAFAAYELNKEGMENMRGRTAYVERMFMSPSGDEIPLVMPIPGANQDTDMSPGLAVSLRGLPGVRGKLFSRAKRRLRAMGKMLRDPIASVEEAMKDPIGFRLELPREQVGTAMLQIAGYLFRNLSAHEIEIEDRNMFATGDTTFRDVKAQIEQEIPAGSIKEIVQKPGQNQFRVFKISAKISVPKDPDAINPIRIPQKIEFQIVDIGNKNEAGMLNHNVYELSQTVAERTRLMGGISVAQLRKMAEEVAKKGGPDANAIIDGLEKNGAIFRLPVTGKKYASVEVWRRWIDAGTLVPPKIAKLVEARLPAKKEKRGEPPSEDFF